MVAAAGGGLPSWLRTVGKSDPSPPSSRPLWSGAPPL